MLSNASMAVGGVAVAFGAVAAMGTDNIFTSAVDSVTGPFNINLGPEIEFVHARGNAIHERLTVNYSMEHERFEPHLTIHTLNMGYHDQEESTISGLLYYGLYIIGGYEYDIERGRINVNRGDTLLKEEYTSERSQLRRRDLGRFGMGVRRFHNDPDRVQVALFNASEVFHSPQELRDRFNLYGGARYIPEHDTIVFHIDEGDIFARDWRTGNIHDTNPLTWALVPRVQQILRREHGLDCDAFALTSFFRNQSSIIQLDGARLSQHRFGRAIDLNAFNCPGLTREMLESALHQAVRDLAEEHGFGGGFGEYTNNPPHGDVRPEPYANAPVTTWGN